MRSGPLSIVCLAIPIAVLAVFSRPCAGQEPSSGAVFHVNADSAALTLDGLSWETAFTSIQDAVAAASLAGGGEVWVAEGEYTSEDDSVVHMAGNVHLYGGFTGSESERGARDTGAHPTVIDGESERTCVLGADNATIDGFTIRHGDYYGFAMYNRDVSPLVRDCIFTDNISLLHGALVNHAATPTIENCVFRGNGGCEGGGMTNFFSSPTVTNCLFIGNVSSGTSHSGCGGGGIHNWQSAAVVTNCTFTANSSEDGAALYSAGESVVTVTNCILWGNLGEEILVSSEYYPYTSTPPVVTYSSIQGGYQGEGNIDQDPLFLDPENDDFHLQEGSPCIDSGISDGAPDADLDGVPRPQGLGIDLGAYEFEAAGEGEGEGPPPPCGAAPLTTTKSTNPFPGDLLAIIATLALLARTRQTPHPPRNSPSHPRPNRRTTHKKRHRHPLQHPRHKLLKTPATSTGTPWAELLRKTLRMAM